MGQTQKLGRTATSVRTEDGTIYVRYHNTDVVAFTDRVIELNSGGWRTVTTKARMNQASSQFGLGFYVRQDKGRWFVRLPGKIYADSAIPFMDGMVLHR
jgi:hypothetical protein